jgi:hypothetical protein
MKMLSATCDQIDQWLSSFRAGENPEDLVVVDDPRLFLSCRLAGTLAGKAHACHGDNLGEEIGEPSDVYAIASEICSEKVNFEIATRIEVLTQARRSVENGDIGVFFRAVEMLKALDLQRGDLDLSSWLEEIADLPGSNHPEIQAALTLAIDLHANWLND